MQIANVSRIMKNSLPTTAKVSKEAKECVQECVSEFISFIVSSCCGALGGQELASASNVEGCQ